MPEPRILSIAHRGFSVDYPENTLAAFRAALDLPVDGCECDVHRSSDGVVYLLHDHTLNRTTGRDAAAEALPWSELQTLDAGAWKDPRFAGERLPRLLDVLPLHIGRAQLVIEIKGGDPALVDGVLAAIEATGAVGWCAVISFDFAALADFAARQPRVPCLYLLSQLPADETARRALVDQVLAARLHGFDLHFQAVDAAFCRLCHQQGLAVWVWTVNSAQAAAPLLPMGIDALTSDRPDWLTGYLGQRPA
ncbi:MAG: hypothetical protein IT204_01010 [Fimbriimonadaceae bacterium]|nr:hypothetical protein [Fimbriimonadaceae bacterium]